MPGHKIPAPRETRGFTLLEVLVALVVVAAVLYVGAGGLSSAARAEAQRETLLLAHWVGIDTASALLLEAPADGLTEDPPPTRAVEMLGQHFELRFSYRTAPVPDALLAAEELTPPPRWLVVAVHAAEAPGVLLRTVEMPVP